MKNLKIVLLFLTLNFFAFVKAQQPAIHVDLNNKVGIGTITPNSPLEVNGSQQFTHNYNYGISNMNIGADHIMRIGYNMLNTTFGFGNINKNNGAFISYDSRDGQPAISIFVKDMSAAYKERRALSVLAPSGNVGIGTIAPTAKLEVGGNVKATSFIGDGSQLTNLPGSSVWNSGANNSINYSGSVGIGTSPHSSYKLDVNGNLRVKGGNIYGDKNLVMRGANAGYVEAKSNNSTFGLIVREYNSSDYGNIEVTSNGLGLGYKTSGSHLQIGTNGNVGISDLNPQYRLTVNGDAAKKGNSNWTVYSDRRLKEDVKPFMDGLQQIVKINPVSFKYNGKGNNKKDGKEYIGVIAQDIQKIAPYMVGSVKGKLNPEDEEETDILDYNNTALVYILVNAVKELSSKNEELTAALKNTTERLQQELVVNKNEIEEIKSILNTTAQK